MKKYIFTFKNDHFFLKNFHILEKKLKNKGIERPWNDNFFDFNDGWYLVYTEYNELHAQWCPSLISLEHYIDNYLSRGYELKKIS